MPLDPNIVLGLRPVNIQAPDPIGTFGRALALKTMLGQQQLQGIQAQEAGLNLAENQAYRQAAMQAGGDLPKLLDLLYKSGAPRSALAVQQAMIGIQQKQAQTQKDLAQATASKLTTHRNMLVGVNDQPSYDQWRAGVVQDFPQFSQSIPEQFSPQTKLTLLQSADNLANRLAPKAAMVDTGQAVTPTNPYTGAPMAPSIAKSVDPNTAVRERVQAAVQDPFDMMGIGSVVERALGKQGQSGAQTATPFLGPKDGAPKGAPVIPLSDSLKDAIQRGVTGDEFLKSLPPDLAIQVKAYADGRQQFPAGFALKSPYFQTMMRMVGQYDPNFDAVNYNARFKTRQSLAAGQMGQNLTRINTAIGHLDSFDKAAQALNNGSVPFVNYVANTFLPQIGATGLAGKVRTFQQAKEAVSNELMAVFRGTGASSGDTAKWAATLNESDSPQALRSAVKSAVDLLESRIEAVNNQYNTGMGTTADTLQMVYPKARATLERLRNEAQGAASAGTPAQSAPAGGIKFLGFE